MYVDSNLFISLNARRDFTSVVQLKSISYWYTYSTYTYMHIYFTMLAL